MKPVKSGVGGWLLLFCTLLLIWQPLSLALVASSALDALPARGLMLALLLMARVVVAAFGIAAGIALVGRRRAAVAMAKVSLALSAATDMVVYTTPYFPNNRTPGQTPLLITGSLAYYAVWMAYLLRSDRVRKTFEESEDVLTPPRDR